MCGIAGILSFDAGLSPGMVLQMADLLRHRGPDDEGYALFSNSQSGQISLFGGDDTPRPVFNSGLAYSPTKKIKNNIPPDATLAFGHRRLSIIDLSAAGHQPMCTPDKRYWIIHNGEVYNYIELREVLRRLGHNFVSNTDTEVILASYQQWGEKSLCRFVGMFAFAIYDAVERRLFLARDFFGIKPLYYLSTNLFFAFASEIPALLVLEKGNHCANPQRVYEYLRFGLTDNNQDTFFRDINQLSAAHYLKIDCENRLEVNPVKYWSINIDRTLEQSFLESTNRVREQFLNNIKTHLRSDVRIGTALSGGLDSSSIVSGIRILKPKQSINAFSYITHEANIGEEKWVDISNNWAKTRSHKVSIEPDELFRDVDHLIALQAEPFEGTSIYAQFRVMKLAKQNGVKVMLDGQGADELLAGYYGFFGNRLASLLLQGRFLNGFHFLISASKLSKVNPKDILIDAGLKIIPRVFHPPIRRILGRQTIPYWLDKNWIQKYEVNTEPPLLKPIGKNILREQLKFYVTNWLPALLRYEDRNSMSQSIESRVPFLTPGFAELLFSLPEEYFMSDQGVSKYIFREAMRGICPDPIIDRRDKIGFATPESKWLLFLNLKISSLFDSDFASEVKAIEIESIKRNWSRMLSQDNQIDYRIWRCANLILWAKLFSISF